MDAELRAKLTELSGIKQKLDQIKASTTGSLVSRDITKVRKRKKKKKSEFPFLLSSFPFFFLFFSVFLLSDFQLSNDGMKRNEKKKEKNKDMKRREAFPISSFL